jgi:hypothetical protein
VTRFLRSSEGWPYLLAPLIPIAIGLDIAGASATAILFTSGIGIIPTCLF